MFLFHYLSGNTGPQEELDPLLPQLSIKLLLKSLLPKNDMGVAKPNQKSCCFELKQNGPIHGITEKRISLITNIILSACYGIQILDSRGMSTYHCRIFLNKTL